MKLIDRRTDDGSRHFVCLPAGTDWHTLRDHIPDLPGAELADHLPNGVSQVRIGFTYRGHHFAVSEQQGEYRLFVRDPQCSDVTLYRVGRHFEDMLGSG